MNDFDEIAKNITNEFDDMLNSITDEEFAELLDASATSGPTVEEYMSNFKVCIFPDFMIEQIKELITFYRNNSDLSEVEKYNLDDIEKNLNTAINWNEFKK